MFTSSEFKLPHKLQYKKDLSEDSEFNMTLRSFMDEEDMICSEITVRDQKYKNGDLIVIEVKDSDNLVVGIIQTLLVRNKKIYFVTRKIDAMRVWLRYFQTTNSNSTYSFVESNQLPDYKPLIRRGRSDKFLFMLHHFISFEYS